MNVIHQNFGMLFPTECRGYYAQPNQIDSKARGWSSPLQEGVLEAEGVSQPPGLPPQRLKLDKNLYIEHMLYWMSHD